MTDNELIGIVAGRLEAASAAAGWNFAVLQKDQPSQQGIPYAPTIFFEKLFDDHYGHTMVNYKYNASAIPTNFSEQEDQLVETTFQISALVIQEPEDLAIPTASDVVNYLRMFLSSRPSIYYYRDNGCWIFRVTQLRNPYFQDERHRYEANPNFDIVFVHTRTLVNTVGATNDVEGAVVSGVNSVGVFPVPDNPLVTTPQSGQAKN